VLEVESVQSDSCLRVIEDGLTVVRNEREIIVSCGYGCIGREPLYQSGTVVSVKNRCVSQYCGINVGSKIVTGGNER
jgi:hypothetical protein